VAVVAEIPKSKTEMSAFTELMGLHVTVDRVGTKSVTYGFAFSHGGRDVAKGSMTSVCCRIPHGGAPISIPIPEVIAAQLRKLAGT